MVLANTSSKTLELIKLRQNNSDLKFIRNKSSGISTQSRYNYTNLPEVICKCQLCKACPRLTC